MRYPDVDGTLHTLRVVSIARTETAAVKKVRTQTASSRLESLRFARQTSRQRRFPGGLLASIGWLTTVVLMPTFSASCSNLARAGELPLTGLSLFRSLLRLVLGDIGSDIGGGEVAARNIAGGEVGGLVTPSKEPSLKRP